MNTQKIGRFLTLFFVAFLPWSVAFSVLGTERLHLDIFRFSKEIIIALIGGIYVFESVKKRIKITIDAFDIATIAFTLTLLGVSVWHNISLKGMLY